MSDAAGGTTISEPPQSSYPSDPQDLKQQVRELIDEGLRVHQAGDLSLAETKYRAALKLDPADSEGLHLLGIIACQNNSHDAAVTLIGHAINNHPDHPAVPPRYNVNLANALHGAGRLEDAVVALHRALSADPSSVEGHFNLGNVLCDLGRFEEAEGEYRFAIQLEPRYGKAHARLGWVLEQLGHPREAIEAIKTAAELNPEDGSLRVGLGRALAAAGRLEEALPLLEELSSEDDAQSWTTLGSCYADQMRWEEARESFSQALKTAPRSAKAHGGLGEALFRLGQCEVALTHLLRACELEPGDMRSLSLAGMISLDQGDLLIALDRLEKAVAGAPDDHRAHAALVHARALQRMSGEEDWRSECAAWVKKFDDHRPMPADGADRLDPHRALRIGVVTGGQPGETALQRLMTFLGYRDRDHVLVRCYSDLDSFEPLRPALIKLADGWTECRALSDGDLSATIHNDKIDILIDLSGSIRGNRLRALARRPAPIQVSWLASGEQMGFSFVDYFLTDAEFDDGSVETSLPVKGGLMAFVAPDTVPQPDSLPLASGNPARFVAMGDLTQFSEESIALFSRVLTELPDSRLTVIVHQPLHRETERRLNRRFADYGVSDRRVELVSLNAGLDEADRDIGPLLERADLALDPFPASNGYESFVALLAGLPVVTLVGPLPQSRLSAGILEASGLGTLRTGSIQEFVERVVMLVENPDHLADLREGLPAKVAGSPVADGAAFARGLEDALRLAWSRHCTLEAPTAATQH